MPDAKPRPNGWDHLPVDLKLKCMEGLSYKDLFRIRSYSKFDRALVDTEFPFTFEYVIVRDDHLHFLLTNGEQYTVAFQSWDMSKIGGLLAHILNNCETNKFYFDEHPADTTFLEEFQELLDPKKFIKVKEFYYQHSKELFQINSFFLLEKLSGTAKKIALDFDQDLIPIDPIFENTAVINADSVFFLNPCHLQVGFLIDNWINHQMHIGTKLRTEIPNPKEADQMVGMLFARFSWQDSQNLRISTKQEDTHIFIHFNSKLDFKIFIWATVISADKPDDERLMDPSLPVKPKVWEESLKKSELVRDWNMYERMNLRVIRKMLEKSSRGVLRVDMDKFEEYLETIPTWKMVRGGRTPGGRDKVRGGRDKVAEQRMTDSGALEKETPNIYIDALGNIRIAPTPEGD